MNWRVCSSKAHFVEFFCVGGGSRRTCKLASRGHGEGVLSSPLSFFKCVASRKSRDIDEVGVFRSWSSYLSHSSTLRNSSNSHGVSCEKETDAV